MMVYLQHLLPQLRLDETTLASVFYDVNVDPTIRLEYICPVLSACLTQLL
jgi:hypothetical protein